MTEAALTLDPAILAALFSPFTLKRTTFANRFLMAPMTREFSPENLLTADAPAYYARRVEGGAAGILTEGSAIPHPASHFTTRVPNFYGPSLAGWAEVARAVHAAGGVAIAQLWHLGVKRDPARTAHPDALSVGPSASERTPSRAMTPQDIAEVIEAYAQGAANAQAAGFDGVEIHGAHGYLPDQFFWAENNRRSDAYGGAMTNRVRFAVELVQEVRRRAGADFLIFFRFSQWKVGQYEARVAETPQELEAWLAPLAEAGVDVFDASTRRFWIPEFEGSAMNLAGWAKKVTGKASMTVGSVGLDSPLRVERGGLAQLSNVASDNLASLAAMFARGDFDLVAVGRILLSNPDWPNLVRAGRFDAIQPYRADLVRQRLESAVRMDDPPAPAEA
ncbi:MAG: 12-oxophytodienoate reductase [Hyphomonadaceae bacterium]